MNSRLRYALIAIAIFCIYPVFSPFVFSLSFTGGLIGWGAIIVIGMYLFWVRGVFGKSDEG